MSEFDDHLRAADMVVIPTWPVGAASVPVELTTALAAAHERGTRLVGLCLGAFVLAEAGVLDAKTAVTHWRYADEFERRFPNVALERDPLYIDHGTVVTSAGSAAALDCCLHLVRRDHGATAASVVARSLVTAPHRAGGQSQFAVGEAAYSTADDLGIALAVAAEIVGNIANVADLVALVPVGRRTLERLLSDRMDTTPREWLADQRVRAASRLLEEATASVEMVAGLVG
ncbi:MAG: GlxA family transcriptional regulator, partial [Actinobacteria bacterium]|nr:GlxA family transcriptional regulator [Actinomycetota bacterium]